MHLAQSQVHLAESKLQLRTLQHDLSAQSRLAGKLQEKLTEQTRGTLASSQAHHEQLRRLKQQHSAEIEHLQQRLGTAEHEQQQLRSNLQQERSSFEAALMGDGHGARQVLWKDKYLAARAELEKLRRDMHGSNLVGKKR